MKDESFTFGVRHIAYNAELRRRRVAKGLFQEDMSKMLGLAPQDISRIEGFRKKPTDHERQLIAKFLECNVNTLFPRWMEAFIVERQSFTTEHIITERLLPTVFQNLLSSGTIEDTEEEIDKELLHEKVEKVLETLTDREAKILKERFGIGTKVTEEEKNRLGTKSIAKSARTLEEVGNEFGVSRDRIRQIEAKAIRKLKHPSRINELREFL